MWVINTFLVCWKKEKIYGEGGGRVWLTTLVNFGLLLRWVWSCVSAACTYVCLWSNCTYCMPVCKSSACTEFICLYRVWLDVCLSVCGDRGQMCVCTACTDVCLSVECEDRCLSVCGVGAHMYVVYVCGVRCPSACLWSACTDFCRSVEYVHRCLSVCGVWTDVCLPVLEYLHIYLSVCLWSEFKAVCEIITRSLSKKCRLHRYTDKNCTFCV